MGKFQKSTIAFILAILTVFSLAGCFGPAFGGGFRISLNNLQLKVGERVVLTTNAEGPVSWLSDDESIIIVEDGLVTAVGEGETTVTAVCGGETAECVVTVTEDYGTDEEELIKKGYKLVWHDEFDGDTLNTEYWGYQTGTHDNYGNSVGPSNWGNNEMQYYREENVAVKDGNLVITAQKEEEKIGGKSYTSGRITTRGKITTTFGYIEARIKLPVGDGLWPAFWMLPQPSSLENSQNEYGGWARNGEIDIMEAKGRVPDSVGNALHFGGGWGENQSKGNTAKLSDAIDNWHTYAVDWRADGIDWIIDGKKVYSLTCDQWWTAAVPSEENPTAPFDKPFFILFNLAIGGTYDPTGTDNLKTSDWLVSEQMLVDYVRVYERNEKK